MDDTKFDVLTASHDIRNNVSVAISYLQLLTMDIEGLQDNEYISSSIQALYSAIDLSEIITTNANQPLDQRNIAPNLVLASVTNQINTYTKPHYQKMKGMYPIDIQDVYDLSDEDKFIAINPASLSRLRENVMHNAINAGASKIEAHYQMKEYCMVVSFTDNGSGMSQDDIDKVLLTEFGDGKIHGIGTKFILKTVEDHGFLVTYSSKIGEGTRVRILCPYANEVLPKDA